MTDSIEPQPRALTLRAFMVLSALYDLRNANTMRPCSLCGVVVHDAPHRRALLLTILQRHRNQGFQGSGLERNS